MLIKTNKPNFTARFNVSVLLTLNDFYSFSQFFWTVIVNYLFKFSRKKIKLLGTKIMKSSRNYEGKIL